MTNPHTIITQCRDALTQITGLSVEEYRNFDLTQCNEAIMAANTYLQANPAVTAEPQGEWVLVPRKPTREMLNAIFLAKDGLLTHAVENGYKAMLEAAPTPPAQTTGAQMRSAERWHEEYASRFSLSDWYDWQHIALIADIQKDALNSVQSSAQPTQAEFDAVTEELSKALAEVDRLKAQIGRMVALAARFAEDSP